MRFTSILLTGALAVFASAQSTPVSAAPSATDPASAAQATIVTCLAACGASDVDCRSRCIAVPNPNEDAANATNDCVAKCPQGNGTEADIAKYGECTSDCIGKFFYTTGGTPRPTGAAGSGSGSGAGSGANVSGGSGDGAQATGTEGAQASGTGAGASPKSSSQAGSVLQVAGSTAGFVGFLAALLAL